MTSSAMKTAISVVPGPMPGQLEQHHVSAAVNCLSRYCTASWLAWPHAHQTRREKRSKLGRENPVVATGLFTLQAMSNA